MITVNIAAITPSYKKIMTKKEKKLLIARISLWLLFALANTAEGELDELTVTWELNWVQI